MKILLLVVVDNVMAEVVVVGVGVSVGGPGVTELLSSLVLLVVVGVVVLAERASVVGVNSIKHTHTKEKNEFIIRISEKLKKMFTIETLFIPAT